MNQLKEKYKVLTHLEYLYYCIGLKNYLKKIKPDCYDRIKNFTISDIERLNEDRFGFIIYYIPVEYFKHMKGLYFRFRFQTEAEAIRKYVQIRENDPDAESMKKECFQVLKDDIIIFSEFSEEELREISENIRSHNDSILFDYKNKFPDSDSEKWIVDFENNLARINKDITSDMDLIKDEIQKEFKKYDGIVNSLKDTYQFHFFMNFKKDEEIVDPFEFLKFQYNIEIKEYLKARLADFDNSQIPVIDNSNSLIISQGAPYYLVNNVHEYWKDINDKFSLNLIENYKVELKKYPDELLLLRSKKKNINGYINNIQRIHDEKIKKNNGLSDGIKMSPDFNRLPGYRQYLSWLENREIELLNPKKVQKSKLNNGSHTLDVNITPNTVPNSYTLISHSINSSHFTNFRNSLFKQNFIPQDTTLPIFRKIFNTEIPGPRIIWLGNISELKYLIDYIHNKLKVITNLKGNIWRVTAKCFVDIDGNEFDYSKFRGQKTPAKAELLRIAADNLK